MDCYLSKLNLYNALLLACLIALRNCLLFLIFFFASIKLYAYSPDVISSVDLVKVLEAFIVENLVIYFLLNMLL